MKRKILKISVPVFILAALLALLCVPAFAISWNGSSAGGGGSGTAAGPNGYAIAATDESNCIGYRFSIVDRSGANKVSKVTDVFRKNNSYASSSYATGYRFTSKRNKKQLIANQNGGFSTSRTGVNCYREEDMGFDTALPDPSGMKIWQNNDRNLNTVLSKLGAGSISSLKNGDRILVEPVYSVRLEGIWHSCTVTEIALYGKHILGAYSNGGASYTSESWGFISYYVNRHYPNALYTPDGMGLWGNASALTAQATFYNIINKGYGAGIAYTETKPDFTPALSVELCEAWPGKTVNRNSKMFGVSRGPYLSDWTYANGYPQSGGSVWFSVSFPAETQNIYVKQTVWVDGLKKGSRTGTSSSLTRYDFTAPAVTDDAKDHYTVKARTDWIESNGTVKKVGAEKTFYIPVRPVINRYKVSAYNIAGEEQAYTTASGRTGEVYAGQRIQTKYTYTSQNTWASPNDLTAVMYKRNTASEEWTAYAGAGGADVSAGAEWISADYPTAKASSLGYVRAAGLDAESGLHANLKTAWTADPVHTQESTWYAIDVVRADVELREIRLVDPSGYYADPGALKYGESYGVRYIYANNTGCDVFVDGFNDSEEKINSSGVFRIPARGTAEVDGGMITAASFGGFSVWGGVYLEGAGIRNTSWESNGDNNELELACRVIHPLSVSVAEPNAPYRENTAVITSFWLINSGAADYAPGSGISCRISVTGENTGRSIVSEVKTDLIVPGSEKNLFFVKWNVPDGMSGERVTVRADLYENTVKVSSAQRVCATAAYTVKSTPDTRYERKKPDSFRTYAVPEDALQGAVWRQFVFENGTFVKRLYCVGFAPGQEICPATGETDVRDAGGKYVMKSGYGISVKASGSVTDAAGSAYTAADPSMFTRAQYVTALLPEFGYSEEDGCCRTLVNGARGYVFRVNGGYGSVHFTPLYYPDGNYTVSIVYSDIWTPGGMITARQKTNTVRIKGSAYDDWYVTHSK